MIMEPSFLGLSAVGWHSMTNSVWEQILAYITLASLVIAGVYVLWRIGRYAIRRLKNRRGAPVSRPVARYLARLRDNQPKLVTKSTVKGRRATDPTSFGVYLGALSSPPTPDQQNLLSQWDVLVIDPLQSGVVAGLANSPFSSNHVIARFDLTTILGADAASHRSEDVIKNLCTLVEMINTRLPGVSPKPSPFTGVLLANFPKYLRPAVINEFARLMVDTGLDLWLELAHPDYLSEVEARSIDMKLVQGLVYRNGMVRQDGDRQDYFQMANLRTTMRAVAGQRVPHQLVQVMWETVEDDVELQYGSVARGYKLYTFYNTLCWVGHTDALYDATIAKSRTIQAKPLGALTWLKDEETMKAHNMWRTNSHVSATPIDHNDLYEALNDFIPDLGTKLQLFPTDIEERPESMAKTSTRGGTSRDSVTSSLHVPRGAFSPILDPLSSSSKTESLTGLGCFQLGHETTYAESDDLRQSQRRLRDLNLLGRIKGDEIAKARAQIEFLRDVRNLGSVSQLMIYELIELLKSAEVDETNPKGEKAAPSSARIKIFTGLHSAFQANGSGTQYWGLYDTDPETDGVILYLSNKAEDRAGAILHTFLSSRQCSRLDCFLAEQAMAELSTAEGRFDETWKLAPRLVLDVEELSPSESILLLERVHTAKHHAHHIGSPFLAKLAALLEYRLVDTPTLTQQRVLSSEGYLGGEVSGEALVAARLAWLADKGCAIPDQNEAVALFEEVQRRLYTVLTTCEGDVYTRITSVIQRILRKGQIDGAVDILALSIFSAFRKFALDEVYLEVLDRNVYPNHSTDQPGCFAEHFALGSRCDSFFDTNARNIGRIFATRYREYYRKYQPPLREPGFTELPTTYAAMQVDFDPDHDGKEKLPFYYHITFFGIFALPALIDVMLLTTIGRGLFLTTFMSNEQKTMATAALMISLLISGAFGAWITSGGSYYFFSSAFPAMNMFIMTRFTAGVAFILLVALVGFVIMVSVNGIIAALTFTFYLVMLSSYMMVLSALSIYQSPGSRFLSGRTAFLFCVPILFVSPIVTMFVRVNDIVVYVPVLTAFLFSILYCGRKTIGQWSSWHINLPTVKDPEVMEWYRERRGPDAKAELDELTDQQLMHIARTELYKIVQKESGRWFRRSSSSAARDPLVARLAAGYEPTMFLMRWYTAHKSSRMPLVYSTTWNLMMNAAIEGMTKMQKGLKMHSAFLHWRTTGLDVWSGLLYFLVALVDKWVALLTGKNLVGLSDAGSETFRLGVGWGLCYYLLGALMLDIVSQPLWQKANEMSDQVIGSLESLDKVKAQDKRDRRRLYARNLLKFFCFHLWSTALFSGLMWAFQSNTDNTVSFIAYVGAYSGLLFYQYNKVFCGFDGAMPLAAGFLVGFPVGIGLHLGLPDFAYSGAVSLGSATWVAGFISLFVAKLGWSSFLAVFSKKTKSTMETVRDMGAAPPCSYSVTTLEPHPSFSESTVSKMFDATVRLHADKRFLLDPNQQPGTLVTDILRSNSPLPAVLRNAFPSAEQLTHLAADTWQRRKTTVELISSADFPPSEDAQIRTMSKMEGDSLRIFVILIPSWVEEWLLNVHRHCRIIAEAIVQATAEHRLGLTHDESLLAELLVGQHPDVSADSDVAITIMAPEGVKYQLEASKSERARFLAGYDKILLRYLLLGIDSEIEWEQLAQPVRSFLLHRLCGSSSSSEVAPLLLSHEEMENWFYEHQGSRVTCGLNVWISRCELGVALTKTVQDYASTLDMDEQFESRNHHDLLSLLDETAQNSIIKHEQPLLTEWATGDSGDATVDKQSFKPKNTVLGKLWSSLSHKGKICTKFLIVALTADPEYQRELDFVIRDKPDWLRWPAVFLLNSIWSYAKFLQAFLVPIVLLYGREHAVKLQKLTKGVATSLEKNRLIVESFSGVSTWFWTTLDNGSLRVAQYEGCFDSEPESKNKLKAVNIYNSKPLVLQKRDTYTKSGVLLNSFEYHYREDSKSRIPIQRECIAGEQEGEVVHYDNRGYQTSGSAMRGVNRVEWKLFYRKSPKHEDELLWGEYVFPHITVKVLWSMPPRNQHKEQKLLEKWIPFSTVTEATFIQTLDGGQQDTYHASWDYEHKFHPQVAVTLNGVPLATAPKMVTEDWLHVLKKPQPENYNFLSENPLVPFSSIKTNALSRFFGFNVKRYPIPTSVARTQVWKSWKSSPDVDAVSARWLDEKLVRSDAVMRPYWRYRDMGRLEAAKAYLDAEADGVLARVDVDPHTSSWTHLAFKMSDLYSFGQGGDARINTRKLESQLIDSDEELHVLAMDTSTWPIDPGGVSNCRRDMIDNLNSIRWHVVAETANDYGVPRYQIERNVQSLTLLPLWGLDFLNPCHGVLETTLDSAVVQRSENTTEADIVRGFLPILTSLVRCSQAVKISRQHVEEATRALVDLNTYFEKSRNWNDVWNHPIVFQRWCELWLSEDGADNAVTISQWWDFELPTLANLENALNLWCRYLFIFSLPVPDRVPDVFQASHHFCGAMYGIVCKVKRDCSLHIWDHCISFREFTTFMSSAVSFDTPFVNSTLISLTHLSCILLEHHADVVLPCCDYFNPGWEVELGTDGGVLEHRSTFRRKIDPVVNGISNMESFQPIKTIKTTQPTVVMLSHVQYPKDLKNAILACDVIVNKWGFRDYRLHMYGEKERHASLATDLIELISSKNLGGHCFLMGLASPSVVLQDAWLFLNSSISEGLPLAMGEAALTGVPVVCTDVGASYCVVTDRATGQRFSEVVAPNDPESLARAQISVMALLGPWAQFAEDEPGTTTADVPTLAYPVPSPDQVRLIQQRMYAKTEQRRALGLRGRANVLKNFSSERYLREHEQMLWIGKERSRANRTRRAKADRVAAAFARELATPGTASPHHSMQGSGYHSAGGGTPGSQYGLAIGSYYPPRRHRESRLTPQSWISLASDKDHHHPSKKKWWSPAASSTTLAL